MSKPPPWDRHVTKPPRDLARLLPDECAGVQRALEALRLRCECSWVGVAVALRVDHGTIFRALGDQAVMTPTFAFRVARVLGVPVADVLEGRFPGDGQCPYCGGVGGGQL